MQVFSESIRETPVHSYIPARELSSFREAARSTDLTKHYDKLHKIGIGFDEKRVLGSLGYAMDAVRPPLVSTASIPVPQQFLQEWLPGFVDVITAYRAIDDLVGISIIGSWEYTQIVQGYLELTADIYQAYSDFSSTPLSSWNTNFIARGIAKFEESLQVGIEESMQASRMRLDSADAKRAAVARSLEITRNSVGFYGYNGGSGTPIYGFLTDPNLPAYTTVAVGASASTLWSTKTFAEIVLDINTMIRNLRVQSQSNVDPTRTKMTLAVAQAAVDYLATPNGIGGISVREWLKENYPNIRITSAPELDVASGSLNVAYLYADNVEDASTDGGATFIQAVPAKLFLTGVQQLSKSYLETYSNATAGVFCKRPWAVVRVQGV